MIIGGWINLGLASVLVLVLVGGVGLGSGFLLVRGVRVAVVLVGGVGLGGLCGFSWVVGGVVLVFDE